MSRIGKIPISIPQEVTVEINGRNIKVSGPKGELSFVMPKEIKAVREDQSLRLSLKGSDKKNRALYGLWRMIIFNAVKGTSEGWSKKLDFYGIGFRAEVQENLLILNVGFSRPIEIKAPEGIQFAVTKNIITVSGIDKQIVGQVAANIRKVRPVEPYKGKGIKYLDEKPLRKVGKAAKVATPGT